MQQNLDSELHTLEQLLNTYFEKGRTLTSEQFHAAPAPDEWSLCQVMEHLLMSETGTLGYMVKKTSSGWDQLETEGADQIQNGTALSTRLQSGEKYKAPSILPEPPNATSLETFERDWPQLRAQLKQFALSVPVEHHSKLIFKQPYAGMISLPHAISFLKNHMAHHLAQVHFIIQHVKK